MRKTSLLLSLTIMLPICASAAAAQAQGALHRINVRGKSAPPHESWPAIFPTTHLGLGDRNPPSDEVVTKYGSCRAGLND